jgi:hypothetical protein
MSRRSDYAVGYGTESGSTLERARGPGRQCRGRRARKQFYSSAVRGRMETQSVGSFQLRWEAEYPLGTAWAWRLSYRDVAMARGSVHGFQFRWLFTQNTNHEPLYP